MPDQKKWFKVWASIINDGKFQNMRLEDIGLWTLLGALMCEQGTNGELLIIPPATVLLVMFRCASLEDLKVRLQRLPNVVIHEASSSFYKNRIPTPSDVQKPSPLECQNPPGLNDNGSFIVIIEKWFKYQVDSTAYDRVKRSRYKKREEEKRRDTTPFLSKKEDPKWM